MADPRLTAQLPHTLKDSDFSQIGPRYRGKVRDVYRRKDTLVLVASDRLSAFDRILTTIPFKGQVLNQLSQFWFEKTAHVVKNHLLEVPDPNVSVVRACEPFRIEVVVRGYLTGSLWRDLQKGAHEVYEVPIPAEMKKDQAFASPILTPSTKEEVGEHDRPISEAGILAKGLASPKDWARIKEAALALFAEGQKWAKGQGLILVDTKYEFGKVGDTLFAIDEIHTPDSSRYWLADGYEDRLARGEDQRMLDKENVRQWLIRERSFSGHGEPPAIPDEVRVKTAEIYLTAFERIAGRPLAIEVGDVAARIEKNLAARGLLG